MNFVELLPILIGAAVAQGVVFSAIFVWLEFRRRVIQWIVYAFHSFDKANWLYRKLRPFLRPVPQEVIVYRPARKG